MLIRDRIKELRRVKASQLRPHPKNWRSHPKEQQEALRGLLAEIGYADALLARELPDGSLELIDGHLRAETTPEQEVPVLVVDLDDREAAKLLALHDPLTGLARANQGALADLLLDVDTQSDAVQAVLDRLLTEPDSPLADAAGEPPTRQLNLSDTFQVVVECGDEAEQKSVFERLTAEGFKCRLLNL